MHSRNFFSLVWVGIIALISPVSLRAVDAEPNILPVSFSCKYGYNGNGGLTIYDGGPNNLVGYDYGSAIESPVGVAHLKPGKTYQMLFAASDVTEYWLSLIAPSGYQFFIDGITQDRSCCRALQRDRTTNGFRVAAVSAVTFHDRRVAIRKALE